MLLLQTLIGFGCGVTMLYRQATLNTAFLLRSVLVSHRTRAHPGTSTCNLVGLESLRLLLVSHKPENELRSFTGHREPTFRINNCLIILIKW